MDQIKDDVEEVIINKVVNTAGHVGVGGACLGIIAGGIEAGIMTWESTGNVTATGIMVAGGAALGAIGGGLAGSLLGGVIGVTAESIKYCNKKLKSFKLNNNENKEEIVR